MNSIFRKIIALIVFACLTLGLLAGCGNAQPDTGSPAASKSDSSSRAESSRSAAADVSEATSDTSPAATPAAEKKSDLIILYTNDVHCAVDDGIGYAGFVHYKKSLEADGYEVILVDAGDAIQGDILGSLSKGELIVQIMNKAGYDAATMGNHEYDYGLERLAELASMADYPYVCCNFVDLRTGSSVYDPYVIIERAGKKIAFVGASTPETMTKSTPVHFQNEKGKFIYDFCGDSDGTKLRETVQAAVKKAREEGADYVILLSHLGILDASAPCRSVDLISGISGVDAVIDGHSHSTVEMERVKDKEGKRVLLTQTGTKLKAFGRLTIREDGEMRSELITDYVEMDPEMLQFIEDGKAKYNKMLSRVVGHTDYELGIADENGNNIIRVAETNLGDFAADSFRYVTGAEIGFQLGGAIREGLSAGDITVGDLITVSPYANQIICVKTTGQAIADALEYGCRMEPESNGGFIQVSGLTYEINLDKKAEILFDDDNVFAGIKGDERRVQNIRVGGEPLDPDRFYTLAGTNYYILDGGESQKIFANEEIMDTVNIEDAQAYELYLTEGLGGEVPETYADRYGEGRITILN